MHVHTRTNCARCGCASTVLAASGSELTLWTCAYAALTHRRGRTSNTTSWGTAACCCACALRRIHACAVCARCTDIVETGHASAGRSSALIGEEKKVRKKARKRTSHRCSGAGTATRLGRANRQSIRRRAGKTIARLPTRSTGALKKKLTSLHKKDFSSFT